MSKRYRPPKHIREAIGKGTITQAEKVDLIAISTPDHLLVDTKAERPRAEWFVTAKLSHKSKFGWHYQRRAMNRALRQNPKVSEVDTVTESRHNGTPDHDYPQSGLPKVEKRAKYGTPEYTRPKKYIYR